MYIRRAREKINHTFKKSYLLKKKNKYIRRGFCSYEERLALYKTNTLRGKNVYLTLFPSNIFGEIGNKIYHHINYYIWIWFVEWWRVGCVRYYVDHLLRTREKGSIAWRCCSERTPNNVTSDGHIYISILKN